MSLGATPSYTIVIVGYHHDQPFLELQGASLNAYVQDNTSFIRSIVIIDDPLSRPLNRIALDNAYGAFAKRVTLIESASFGALPHCDGWRRQQALKLLASRIVETERYVILDAKNHLINPLCRHHLESPDSRFMRSYLQDFRGHSLNPLVTNACRYFSLPAHRTRSFLPSVTPYVASTRVVRELLNYIETRERQTFGEFFGATQHTAPVNEFGLYGAYILFTMGSFETLYKFDAPICSTIWERSEELIERQRHAERRPFFGVHRRAFKNFDTRGKLVLAKLWHRKKLFNSVEAGYAFVEACSRFYR
jgi:hypothetical protein